MTSLIGGTRVYKDDLRIECLGQLDELNAAIGLCKVTANDKEMYADIQRQLMQLMTVVSYPSYDPEVRLKETPAKKNVETLVHAVRNMELFIQSLSDKRPFAFTLPGESILNANLHLARSKCRTCERRLVALFKDYITDRDEDRIICTSNTDSSNNVEETAFIILIYINRLSDYLYALSLTD